MPPIVIRTKLIVERGTFFFLFVLLIFDLLVLNNVIIGTFFIRLRPEIYRTFGEMYLLLSFMELHMSCWATSNICA